MKGLVSVIVNGLNDYKLTVHIKKRDVLAASIAASKRTIIEGSTVEPDINTNSNAKDLLPSGKSESKRGSRRE